ncbi:MAG: hypothetical protein RIC56_15405 [Pseudomonadales bacterium]
MKILSHSLIALVMATLFACDSGAGPAAAEAAQSPQGQAPAPSVDACLTCHAGPMGFAGKDPAGVAASLRDIVAGERAHPPFRLEDTSDAALDALAARLTAP